MGGPPLGSSLLCLLTTTHELSPRSDLFKSCYLRKWCHNTSCYTHQTSGIISGVSAVLTSKCWLSIPNFSYTCPPVSRTPWLLSPLVWITEITSYQLNFHSSPVLPSPIHSLRCYDNYFFETQFWSGHPCLNTSVICIALKMKTIFLTWPVKSRETSLLWPLTSLTPPASLPLGHLSLSVLEPPEFSFIFSHAGVLFLPQDVCTSHSSCLDYYPSRLLKELSL